MYILLNQLADLLSKTKNDKETKDSIKKSIKRIIKKYSGFLNIKEKIIYSFIVFPALKPMVFLLRKIKSVIK